jgi:hypothetical protein
VNFLKFEFVIGLLSGVTFGVKLVGVIWSWPYGVDNIFKVKNNGIVINRFAKNFRSTLQNISPTLGDVPKFYASFSMNRILQRLYFHCLYKEENKLKNLRHWTKLWTCWNSVKFKSYKHLDFLTTFVS